MNINMIRAIHANNSFIDILKSIDEPTFEAMMISNLRNMFPLPIQSSIDDQVASEPSIEPIQEPLVDPIQENSDESDESLLDDSLSDEQRAVVKMALKNESMFLTAPAGYGKSYVISTIVHTLKEKYDKDSPIDAPSKVGVCASTGRAASLINGRTLHSFLGIGLARCSAIELHNNLFNGKVKQAHAILNLLRELRVLIIDEISMIDNVLIDKVSTYLKLIRENDLPFGGVQMIFVGDLHQLPPINNKYFIESNSYRELMPWVMKLTKCFRQDDPEFQKILSEARIGKLSNDSYNKLISNKEFDSSAFPGLTPMLLRSTNREVDEINEREFAKLTTTKQTYHVIPVSGANLTRVETVCKTENIPETLELAIGAQVIITYNVSPCIPNGLQGIVTDIYPKSVTIQPVGSGPPVRVGYIMQTDGVDKYNKPLNLFEYIPMRLGYAMTIHKAQGMTTSLLEVNLNRVFAAGQGYVALSRVRSLKGVRIIGLKRNTFVADPKIIHFYKNC